MNDQSPRWTPGCGGDDPEDDDRRKSAQSLQRAFMERARRAVEHEQEKRPRRVGQHVIALAAAFALTFGIVYVFDAFLSSMQKVMRMMDEQEERQQQEEAERKKKEPMPAYVVPAD
jgi:Na+-transporting methylmalonyl-CoA/oxaloacetate decarboxylase gamma subunit